MTTPQLADGPRLKDAPLLESTNQTPKSARLLRKQLLVATRPTVRFSGLRAFAAHGQLDREPISPAPAANSCISRVIAWRRAAWTASVNSSISRLAF